MILIIGWKSKQILSINYFIYFIISNYTYIIWDKIVINNE